MLNQRQSCALESSPAFLPQWGPARARLRPILVLSLHNRPHAAQRHSRNAQPYGHTTPPRCSPRGTEWKCSLHPLAQRSTHIHPSRNCKHLHPSTHSGTPLYCTRPPRTRGGMCRSHSQCRTLRARSSPADSAPCCSRRRSKALRKYIVARTGAASGCSTFLATCSRLGKERNSLIRQTGCSASQEDSRRILECAQRRSSTRSARSTSCTQR